MLEPGDRTLLREALRPPIGYRLDRAITTTFSLDLVALLTWPVAFTMFDLPRGEDRRGVDPLAVLEALRRFARRIHVFCQAGQIHEPARTQQLFAYIEQSIHEAAAPRGGAFHPKLTALRYVPESPEPGEADDVQYRVLCGSRNLTFDRSWDTMLRLDGRLTRRRKAHAANRPLSAFVAALPRMALRPTTAAKEAATLVADELLRVTFDAPEKVRDLRFWPLGIDDSRDWPFEGRRDRMVIVSPFVTDGFLERIAADVREVSLVSRQEELDELPGAALESVDRAFVLSEAVETELAATTAEHEGNRDAVSTAHGAAAGDGDDGIEIGGEGVEQLAGLHAKLYVADAGHSGRVWIGSANGTMAAFTQNVEFLVELEGTRQAYGTKSLLPAVDVVDGENDKSTRFVDLLEPYRRREAEADPRLKQLEKALEDAKRQLAMASLRADVDEALGDEQATHRVTVTADEPLALRGSVEVRCWPVTLRAEAGQRVDFGESPVAVFDRLSTEAITSFFVFELRSRLDELSRRVAFVLNLPLHGAPADREKRVLASLLSSAERFMQYLLMLLADDEVEAMQWLEVLNEGGDGQWRGDDTTPLLEPLLRAADRRPDRLDEIERLLRDLSATESGRDLLPEGFESVWRAIRAARKGETCV